VDTVRTVIDSPLVLGPPLALYLVVVLALHRRWTALGTLYCLAAGVYVAGVLHFTLFPIEWNHGVYRSRNPWYNGISPIPLLTADLSGFVLNVVMMVPLGVFAALLWPKPLTIKQVALVGLVASAFIEITQVVLYAIFDSGRSADVNDLIANTLGCVLGYLATTRVLRRATVA